MGRQAGACSGQGMVWVGRPLLVPASARVAGRGWLGYGEGGEGTIEYEPGMP